MPKVGKAIRSETTVCGMTEKAMDTFLFQKLFLLQCQKEHEGTQQCILTIKQGNFQIGEEEIRKKQ